MNIFVIAIMAARLVKVIFVSIVTTVLILGLVLDVIPNILKGIQIGWDFKFHSYSIYIIYKK